MAALAEYARDHVAVGMPADPDAAVGPVNNPAQLARVQGFLDRLPDHAEIRAGGSRVAALGDGYFLEPTVVSGLAQDEEAIQDEIFGPVITVQRFTDEEQAIRWDFNKVAPQLRAGQDIGRDIFVFTDWMANRVIRDQLAQPLELIRMPHAANLRDSLKDVSFDPGRQFSLTWQSGFAGIGYNKEKVGRELKTIGDLWADDLKGRWWCSASSGTPPA